MEGMEQGITLPLAKCPDLKVEKLFTLVLIRTSDQLFPEKKLEEEASKTLPIIAHLRQVEQV